MILMPSSLICRTFYSAHVKNLIALLSNVVAEPQLFTQRFFLA